MLPSRVIASSAVLPSGARTSGSVASRAVSPSGTGSSDTSTRLLPGIDALSCSGESSATSSP
jgi:hypothetical protein